MSRKLNQPVGQKKFDNVAIVRLEKGGKRFEVATYKNKVQQYREGIEKNLDEVFQIREIFSDVKTGTVANEKEMAEIFKTSNRDAISRAILKNGRIQVNSLERKQELERLTGEIANLACEQCIYTYNHQTLEPILMEKALKEHGFNVRMDKPAKVQALKLINFLAEAGIPLARAPMHISVKCPADAVPKLLQLIEVTCCTILTDVKSTSAVTYTLLISPDPFTHFQHLAWNLGWTVEILQFRYRAEQTAAADSAIAAKEEKMATLPHEIDAPLWRTDLHWCAPNCIKEVGFTFALVWLRKRNLNATKRETATDNGATENNDELPTLVLDEWFTMIMQFVGTKPWTPWSNAPGIRASENAKKMKYLKSTDDKGNEADRELQKQRDDRDERDKKKKKKPPKRGGKKKARKEEEEEDSDAELENYTAKERKKKEAQKLKEQREKEKEKEEEDEFDYGSYESDGNYTKYGG